MSRLAGYDRGRLAELWRFYQAAVVNTAFGFGLYAILVALGLNLFLAQALAFACGVTFNYITYSRHVFRGAEPAKLRFLGAYAVNYVVNLGFLALFNVAFHNAYVAGALSSLAASLLNYFALKHAVFGRMGA